MDRLQPAAQAVPTVKSRTDELLDSVEQAISRLHQRLEKVLTNTDTPAKSQQVESTKLNDRLSLIDNDLNAMTERVSL